MPQEMRFFTQEEELKNQQESSVQATNAERSPAVGRTSGKRPGAKPRDKKRWLEITVLVTAGLFILALLLFVFSQLSGRPLFGAASATPSSGAGMSASQVVAQPDPPASEPAEQAPTPEPTPDLPAAPAVSTDDWFAALVTNQQPMPEGYDPATDPIDPAGYYFDARAAQQVIDMVAAAADENLALKVNSGFRSVARQQLVHDQTVTAQRAAGLDAEQAELAAQRIQPNAGYSEHNLGLAVDFVTNYNHRQTEFAQTPEFQWLVEHAAEYGFILRYPEDKQEITGMEYKPWHWRYVGQELAAFLKEQNLTLDEFYSLYLS